MEILETKLGEGIMEELQNYYNNKGRTEWTYTKIKKSRTYNFEDFEILFF